MVTPYEEAKLRALEIQGLGLVDQMFVTISLGGEYTNSFDVDGNMSMPTGQVVQQIQKRLNELGATPKLAEDGVMGPATLKAILTALKPRT